MYNGVYHKEQFAYMHDTLLKWLDVRLKGNSLGDSMWEKGIKKVALYGGDKLGEMAFQDLEGSKVKVVGFIDKNAGRYGFEKQGLPIWSLEQMGQLPEDIYILVTPEYYFYEIMADLLEKGISLGRIISLSMVV